MSQKNSYFPQKLRGSRGKHKNRNANPYRVVPIFKLFIKKQQVRRLAQAFSKWPPVNFDKSSKFHRLPFLKGYAYTYTPLYSAIVCVQCPSTRGNDNKYEVAPRNGVYRFSTITPFWIRTFLTGTMVQFTGMSQTLSKIAACNSQKTVPI